MHICISTYRYFPSFSCSCCNTNCPLESWLEMNQIKSLVTPYESQFPLQRNTDQCKRDHVLKLNYRFSFAQEQNSAIYIIRLFAKLRKRKIQINFKGHWNAFHSDRENNFWLQHTVITSLKVSLLKHIHHVSHSHQVSRLHLLFWKLLMYQIH